MKFSRLLHLPKMRVFRQNYVLRRPDDNFLVINLLCFCVPGETLGKAWVVIFMAVINAQTMAFYGSFSVLISMRVEVPRAIGLGLGAGVGLMNIYRWCNEAQKVEQCVSSFRIVCSY